VYAQSVRSLTSTLSPDQDGMHWRRELEGGPEIVRKVQDVVIYLADMMKMTSPFLLIFRLKLVLSSSREKHGEGGRQIVL
jgi:hypothetical protein